MAHAVSLDHQTLQSFFFAALEEAQDRSGRTVPAAVGAYLVDLLSRYARRPGVAGRTSKALAIQYLSAREAAGPERAQALRGVGDRALYIAGVVPRSLHRGPVGVGYVRSIGASAYLEVSTRSRALEVFALLAERFEDASELMGDVVHASRGDDEPDLLELYERWRDHGDERDLRHLIRAGVLIDPDGSDTLQ